VLVMEKEKEADYYTPSQVAEKLQLEAESVTRLLRQGKLPGYKVGGAWRINKAEFARFMETQRNAYPKES
jgi:excisionase family DNA binding protein